MHTISWGAKTVLFDITQKEVSCDYDFIFNDGESCKVRFLLSYVPIVDSLGSFYERHHSNSIEGAVIGESMGAVRELFLSLNKNSLTNEQMTKRIVETIKNDKVTSFVTIESIGSVDICY